MTLEENIRAILECNFTGYKDEIIDIATKNIMNLSDIENRKTGHWIRITNGAIREKYICSECHRQIEDYGVENLLPIKYPYCHCGAKMERDKTEKICYNCIHNKESEPIIENCATCYAQSNFTPKPEGD